MIPVGRRRVDRVCFGSLRRGGRPPSSSGLGRRPFTPVTRVRIPLGTPASARSSEGCPAEAGQAVTASIATMRIDAMRHEILRLAASRGARHVRVFGSVARGDDHGESDVDFLVDMEAGRSLLDLVGLEQDLEELLHRKVDVLTERSLHPALRDQVLAEAREL